MKGWEAQGAEPHWLAELDRSNGAADRRSIARAALGAALHFSDAPMGNVQLLDRRESVLRIVAQHGFERRFLNFFAVVHSDTSACGSAMRSEEQVVIDDVETSSIFDEDSRRAVLDAGVRSVTSVPIIDRGGQVAGVVSVHFREQGSPKPRVLTRIDLVARRISQLL